MDTITKRNMSPEMNDRDTALRVKGHLYELEQVNDEVIGGQQGWPMAIVGFEKTLQNVANCADYEALDEVAKYVKDYMRRTGERPANRKVRRKARAIVTEHGYPATPYLNSA